MIIKYTLLIGIGMIGLILGSCGFHGEGQTNTQTSSKDLLKEDRKNEESIEDMANKYEQLTWEEIEQLEMSQKKKLMLKCEFEARMFLKNNPSKQKRLIANCLATYPQNYSAYLRALVFCSEAKNKLALDHYHTQSIVDPKGTHYNPNIPGECSNYIMKKKAQDMISIETRVNERLNHLQTHPIIRPQ